MIPIVAAGAAMGIGFGAGYPAGNALWRQGRRATVLASRQLQRSRRRPGTRRKIR